MGEGVVCLVEQDRPLCIYGGELVVLRDTRNRLNMWGQLRPTPYTLITYVFIYCPFSLLVRVSSFFSFWICPAGTVIDTGLVSNRVRQGKEKKKKNPAS